MTRHTPGPEVIQSEAISWAILLIVLIAGIATRQLPFFIIFGVGAAVSLALSVFARYAP